MFRGSGNGEWYPSTASPTGRLWHNLLVTRLCLLLEVGRERPNDGYGGAKRTPPRVLIAGVVASILGRLMSLTSDVNSDRPRVGGGNALWALTRASSHAAAAIGVRARPSSQAETSPSGQPSCLARSAGFQHRVLRHSRNRPGTMSNLLLSGALKSSQSSSIPERPRPRSYHSSRSAACVCRRCPRQVLRSEEHQRRGSRPTAPTGRFGHVDQVVQ